MSMIMQDIKARRNSRVDEWSAACRTLGCAVEELHVKAVNLSMEHDLLALCFVTIDKLLKVYETHLKDLM